MVNAPKSSNISRVNPGKRSRSPSFPYIALQSAVQRAQAYALIERRHSARVTRAVTHWGYKEKSSGGQQTVAALVAYGLMEDIGSGDLRKVQLTELGWHIVHEPSPDSSNAALQKAALTPRVFSDMWAQWGAKLPPTDECLSYLTAERGFTEKAGMRVLELFKENLSFTRLDISDSFSLRDETAGFGSQVPIKSPVEAGRPMTEGCEERLITPDGVGVRLQFDAPPTITAYRFLQSYIGFKLGYLESESEPSLSDRE